MGAFFGVTASNGARIKEGKVEEVMKVLDKYDFSCGLEYRIDNGSIAIFGYEWPCLWLKSERDADQDCEVYFEQFLKELSPFLSENLVIHAIGNEKCVFPLAAMEIRVTPHDVTYGEGFKWLS